MRFSRRIIPPSTGMEAPVMYEEFAEATATKAIRERIFIAVFCPQTLDGWGYCRDQRICFVPVLVTGLSIPFVVPEQGDYVTEIRS